MVETDEEKKVREEKDAAEKKAAEEADAAKKKEEEEKAAAAKAPEGEGKSPLEEARALDKSIKEGSAKIQKLLEKNEKIMADAAISGKGFAGQGAAQIESEDAKWAREAKERYAGTGLDPTPDDGKPTTYS